MIRRHELIKSMGCLLVLFGAASLFYLKPLWNQVFIRDDWIYFSHFATRNFSEILHDWQYSSYTPTYMRPLQQIYLLAMYTLFKLDPHPYFMINMICLMAHGAVLYALAERLTHNRLLAFSSALTYLAAFHILEDTLFAADTVFHYTLAPLFFHLCLWAMLKSRPLAALIAYVLSLFLQEGALFAPFIGLFLILGTQNLGESRQNMALSFRAILSRFRSLWRYFFVYLGFRLSLSFYGVLPISEQTRDLIDLPAWFAVNFGYLVEAVNPLTKILIQRDAPQYWSTLFHHIFAASLWPAWPLWNWQNTVSAGITPDGLKTAAVLMLLCALGRITLGRGAGPLPNMVSRGSSLITGIALAYAPFWMSKYEMPMSRFSAFSMLLFLCLFYLILHHCLGRIGFSPRIVRILIVLFVSLNTAAMYSAFQLYIERGHPFIRPLSSGTRIHRNREVALVLQALRRSGKPYPPGTHFVFEGVRTESFKGSLLPIAVFGDRSLRVFEMSDLDSDDRGIYLRQAHSLWLGFFEPIEFRPAHEYLDPEKIRFFKMTGNGLVEKSSEYVWKHA